MSLTKTQTFSAKIGRRINGDKTLSMTSPRWYQNALNQFSEGETVTLVITSQKPKRSDQQNRYYWGAYLPLIAEETGEDVDRLHELFKGLFLTKEVVEVMGRKVRIKESTTRLNKTEFTEYIMKIEDMTGILSPPVENYL